MPRLPPPLTHRIRTPILLTLIPFLSQQLLYILIIDGGFAFVALRVTLDAGLGFFRALAVSLIFYSLGFPFPFFAIAAGGGHFESVEEKTAIVFGSLIIATGPPLR